MASLLFASGKLPANVRALGFTVAGLGLALALPWLDVSSADGLGFRMRLIAYLPWALCTAIVVGAGLRTLSKLPPRTTTIVTTIVVIASLVFAVTRKQNRREGVVFTDEHMVSAISAANAYLGKSYVIVTDRHIGFMTQYYGETDAHLVAEPFPAKTTWRLLTGNFISRNAGLRDVIRQAQNAEGVAPPIGVHPLHPMGVVIMPEATWQWILPRLPDQSRDRLAAWFPQTDAATS